ncbi:MAG: ATP-binding cassette domain-containing protein [Clostridia bacterium]|nr:ATP-binding cassette domain-containing protein [Clostridia bacterium]
MISLNNISFSYEKKNVLKDFSLTVPDTGRIALMGPSGCGKTTVLRLLMGLEKPASGSITNAPYPVAAVFQEDRLLSHKTVLENAALATGNTEKAATILEKLGLGVNLHQYPAELSGGMRRRVAIARALCTPSRILVLDEPFNGLDDDTKHLTADLILKEWKGAILMVTHLKEEAELLGAKILPMKNK